MTHQPGVVDVILLVAMAALTTAEVIAFQRLSRNPSNDARVKSYAFFIAYQWLLAAAILVAWSLTGRSWNELLLGAPHPIGFAISSAIALAYAAFALSQLRLLDRPGVALKARGEVAKLEWLTPHSSFERRLWWVAALTAGCCEELFFRGFLFACVTQYTGVIAAVAITAAMFGLYHAYYGVNGIVKTGAFGLVMSLIAIGSGSLLPAMALHFLVDLLSGEAAYRVTRSYRSA
jgi:uncharacterized protein